ncbi:lysophospholipid acyltransferase family protein [Desulfobacca acetoxidans]|uniref:Lipid A biosynthesis acyltransferase n=1 Tax=Desulfobacca acetoxidans (strain ATCC 700848 / DSM 11109 / ASRB2) TaxID=880072 RepID=F2NCT4_DESAR|nr:lysophospholipid acyltransferase family protein [Desulfobacca acetoxidans]AEB09365.1 lipid A biosynthesis acyltransferase [Desulfobacca acetoxidans DSM 11109]
MISTDITRKFARLWYRLDRRHRLITLRNLEFALGRELTDKQREGLAQAVFDHFIRIFFEAIALLLFPASHIRRRVVVIGQEHAEAALKQGKGIIAIIAHAGNWEYTALGYGLKNFPIAIVGREHDHPVMNRIIRFLRERGGNLMIPKRGGFKAIISLLKRNCIIGMAIDQNTSTRGGMLVDFFGHRVRTTPIAALLSRRLGTPVLPVFSRRLPDGRHLMHIHQPLPMINTSDYEADIEHQVQVQTYAIESWVRRYPDQWLWLHRRWKNRYPELYNDL